MAGDSRSEAVAHPSQERLNRPAHALRGAREHIGKSALRLLVYAVLAYLVLRLVPALEQAFTRLQHVSWRWVLVAVAIETLSEVGFVVSWDAIVDREHVVGGDGRSRSVSVRVAWAQLGSSTLVPGGSIASIGVGSWILHRFGVPARTIAERQFNLSFLNTAVDGFALVLFGLGLAVGVLAGSGDLDLTLLPAVVAAVAIMAALVVARVATGYADRISVRHARVSAALGTLAAAVTDTRDLLVHPRGWRAVAGALAYLLCDMVVLWSAFLAIHAPHVPPFGVIAMAYLIGALGGSLPLPAGIGAIGGIAGMLILYGVNRYDALGAVLLYEAVGLLVPFVGGSISYLWLRRDLRLQGSGAPIN